MTEEKTWAYKDMQVAYTIAGKPSAEAIVFLHPAFADRSVFQYQTAYFQKDYFVITVDMTGHGQSQLNQKQVDMGDMPDIIKGVCDASGVTRAHLVGVSLGSLVAQAVAQAYPELAASVTIVGGYSIHKDNQSILKAQKKEILRWTWRMLVSIEALKQDIVTKSASSEEGQAILKASVSAFTRRSSRGMAGMRRLFIERETPVPYPLLIVVGESDMPLIREAGERLKALEPGSQFKLIQGAGHCANIDNPMAFNAVLEAFLAQLK